ncbi:MAG: hypothetical protein Q8R30_04520 [bacterium]|nr:hypothetical protein [bacterium]MDZ4285453.1 hypothetical protein [Candidatus Sungbacteria bacterium]
MADESALTHLERCSIITTIVLVPFLAILAGVSAHYQWWLVLAASMGGLGGIAHEIAQSGGKILFFQRNKDGVYLGSAAGIVLGAVAGILIIRGYLPADAPLVSATQLSYEIFLAGLGFKGMAEAATGNAVK